MTISYIGVNLDNLNYFTTDQWFINRAKLFSGWVGRNGSIPESFPGAGDAGFTFDDGINMDTNEYPMNMQGKAGTRCAGITFTQFEAAGLISLSPTYGTANGYPSQPYKSGTWVCLYDGSGTISYQGATKTGGSAGRDNLTVSADDGGIRFVITATDPGGTGNYIRNIRLFPTDEEALFNAGEIFQPDFLNYISQAKLLRFMKPYDVDGQQTVIKEWTDRKIVTQFEYCNKPPPEIPIALVNKLSAGKGPGLGCVPHFCMNFIVSDDYITQFATLAHNTLNMTAIPFVIVEHGNEPWLNIAATEYPTIHQRGYTLFPAARTGFAAFIGSISGTTLTISSMTSGNISPFDFKGHVFIGASAYDENLKIATQLSSPTSSFTGVFVDNGNGTSTLTASAVTGTIPFDNSINACIFGTGLDGSNTAVIQAQLTGPAGGAGTYTVRNAGFALSSRAMTAGKGGDIGTYTLTKSMGTVSSTAMSQGSDFQARIDYLTSRAVRTGQLWKAAWGADAAKVKIALGGRGGTGDFHNALVLAFDATHDGSDPSTWGNMVGPVGNNIDALLTNGYFGPIHIPAPGTVDTYFASLDNLSDIFNQWTIDKHDAAPYPTTSPGTLPVWVYECGPNLSDTTNTDIPGQAIQAACNYDSRMGLAVTAMFNMAKSFGISVIAYYSAIGRFQQYGFWGLQENIYQAPTPKYQAWATFAAGRNYTNLTLNVTAGGAPQFHRVLLTMTAA